MVRKQLGDEGAERLGRIEILSELPLGRRRELARLADEVIADAGETLMHQGETAYDFMMLEEGHADVIKDGERINVLGPGDSFGELAVLEDGQPRSASVTASTGIRAIGLSAHFMREMHDRLPAAGEQLDRIAAQRREDDALRAQDGR